MQSQLQEARTQLLTLVTQLCGMLAERRPLELVTQPRGMTAQIHSLILAPENRPLETVMLPLELAALTQTPKEVM